MCGAGEAFVSSSQLFEIEKPDRTVWDRFIDLLDSIPGFIIGLFVVVGLLPFFLPLAIVIAAALGVVALAAIPMSLRSFLSERSIVRRMRSAGRTITGMECIARLLRGEGTLIIEGGPFSGNRRWWWTSDHLDPPYRSDLEDLAAPESEMVTEVHAQYQRDYFGPDGKALLVARPGDRKALLQDGREFKAGVHWIQVFSPPIRRPSPHARKRGPLALR
jgi:hypothetical protein